MPSGVYGTFVGNDTTQTKDTYYVAEGRWNKEFDVNKSLMARVYYEDYTYGGHYLYNDPVNDYNEDHTRDQWVGLEAQYNWQPVEPHRLTFGMVYEFHWTTLDGFYDDPAGARSFTYPGFNEDFSLVAFYAQDEYRIIQPLAVTVSGRYDAFTNIGVDHFSPRVALVWTRRTRRR